MKSSVSAGSQSDTADQGESGGDAGDQSRAGHTSQ